MLMADALGPFTALHSQTTSTRLVTINSTRFTLVSLFVEAPYKASAVFTEGGFDVGGLCEGVDEAHLTVEQRAGLHEVVDHLFPADLPILVFVQFSKLAEVGEVVPDDLKLLPGDVTVPVHVKVLEDRVHHLLYVFVDDRRVGFGLHRRSPLVNHRWLGGRSRGGAGAGVRWFSTPWLFL